MLSKWTKDFNTYSQRKTHTQVWIRLREMPHEYWHERTLLEIVGAIGTPLIIDCATKNRVFGHYARILVDIGFSCRVLHEIMVVRDEYAFKVEVSNE